MRLNDKIQLQSKTNAFSASYNQARCTDINLAVVDANNNTGNAVTRAGNSVSVNWPLTFFFCENPFHLYAAWRENNG